MIRKVFLFHRLEKNLELTIKDIVFVSLKGDIEKNKKPSSEGDSI